MKLFWMDHCYLSIFVVIYRCKNINTCNNSVDPFPFILTVMGLVLIIMADCVSRQSNNLNVIAII